MDFERVAEQIAGIPHMRPRQGRKVYDHVIEHRLGRVLELGTHHGVSTCYLAGAVDEIGGSVTTIDRVAARELDPNVEQLAERAGLAGRVTAVFAERSYTWELRKMLDQSPVPQFDFIFIDGGHEWDVTGFAFFLADRLLAPGGWLLFDDLNWSFAGSPSLRDKDHVLALPAEEREAQQVGDVFRLLVATDPRYTTRADGNWGWAQKNAVVDQGAGAATLAKMLDAGRRVGARAGVRRFRSRLVR